MKKDYCWIKSGVKCRWNDPGINDYEPEERQGVLARVFEVVSAPQEIEDDTVILISDGHSEAEVYASELEPVEVYYRPSCPKVKVSVFSNEEACRQFIWKSNDRFKRPNPYPRNK